MKKIFSRKTGFTLIELLVVIAIIAILTGIVATNFTSARARARDAKRISDLGQIQLALELYFDRCKQYPEIDDGASTYGEVSVDANNCTAAGVTLKDYITKIPNPPLPVGAGQTYYEYVVDDQTKPTDYVLRTVLEEQNEVIKDALAADPYAILPDGCSDVPANKLYCLGPQ